MRRSKRRRLENLWHTDPHCSHCGQLTILVDPQKDRPFYDNEATIDHVYSRLDPRRYVPKQKGEVRRILACRKCNGERGGEENRALSLRTRRRLAQEGKERKREFKRAHNKENP